MTKEEILKALYRLDRSMPVFNYEFWFTTNSLTSYCVSNLTVNHTTGPP